MTTKWHKVKLISIKKKNKTNGWIISCILVISTLRDLKCLKVSRISSQLRILFRLTILEFLDCCLWNKTTMLLWTTLLNPSKKLKSKIRDSQRFSRLWMQFFFNLTLIQLSAGVQENLNSEIFLSRSKQRSTHISAKTLVCLRLLRKLMSL